LVEYLLGAQDEGRASRKLRGAAMSDWIISVANAKELESRLPLSELQSLFGAPGDEILARYPNSPVGTAFSAATPGEIFSDANQLAVDMPGSGVPVVVYDPEAWDRTPVAQQHSPHYEQAAAVVHAAGKLFETSPASDLAGTGMGRFQEYLDDGVAAAAAKHADIFVIQAQKLANDPSEYAWFVEAAAAQARAANPHVEIIAGLTTSVGATTAELMADYQATENIVKGYELNITNGSDPTPLVGFLIEVYAVAHLHVGN
jgi:hypothetical protein